MDIERTLPQDVKYVLGFERSVEVTDAGMIESDDQMRTPEILTNHCMQQRFPGAGVAHFDRVARLHYGRWQKVIFDHRIDGFDADIGRNFAGFEPSKHLVDQHAITHLDGDLGQMLVAAVHGRTGLIRGYLRPSFFGEHGPHL